MSEITIFKFQSHSVRTVTDEHGNPWFVAKDVCEVLDIANPRNAMSRIPDTQKGVRQMDTLGGTQRISIISEAGLYRLVMRSDKPEAEPFIDWVTAEVLPAIRKTGGYIRAAADETPEEIMARALIVAKDTIDRLKNRVEGMKERIESMKPKELFADAVSSSKTSILVGELAKILKQNGVDIGQNRLFSWLRNMGWLIRRKGTDYNMPTQRSMELGLFDVKENAIAGPDGTVRVTKTPKVTGKGQVYFVNLFLKMRGGNDTEEAA